MASWARDDVDSAATWAQTLPVGPQRREAYSSIVEVLARSQPEKAIAFVDSVENESDRTRYASTMAVHLASVAPEVALEWIRKQPPSSSIRTNATDNLVSNWAISDPGAAIHFIETLEGDARKQGMKRLVNGFAYREPERAAAILDSDATLIDRSSISNIVYSWGDKDPQAAATWISTLPTGAAKQDAHRVVIIKWAEADPAAASQWVADIPAEDATRDWAMVYLSRGLVGNDPEAALHWAAEVKEPQHGPSVRERAAKSWVEQDRTAAQAALDSGQVPEAAREALIKQLAIPE